MQGHIGIQELDRLRQYNSLIPVEDKTIMGGFAFLISHESYHVGQLGLLRKELGLSTIFGLDKIDGFRA